MQIRNADELRMKQLKRVLINKLRTAVSIKQYEEEQDINKMSKTAFAFHDFNIKMRVL